MGHKIHTYGLRVGFTKPHTARWIGVKKQDYRDMVARDVKIREVVDTLLKPAGIDKVEVIRTSQKTELIIYVSRVGMAVGEKGSNVQRLRKEIEKVEGKGRSIEIKIRDIKQMGVSAAVVAHLIARGIEKRRPVRQLVKKAIESIRRTGVMGAKVQVKGRIGGSENTLTYKKWFGRVPLQTIRADIDYAYERAETATAGVLSVKVWIYRGEIFV